MKRLYLIRHAKAEWRNSTQPDFDRPLSDLGMAEAEAMGRLLASKSAKPDLLMTSPAVRALETSKIIAREVGYDELKIVTKQEIYDGYLQDWVQIIRQIQDECQTVFLVGHNPTITDFVHFLTDTNIRGMPTCGSACLRCDKPSWLALDPGAAEFSSFDTPHPI